MLLLVKTAHFDFADFGFEFYSSQHKSVAEGGDMYPQVPYLMAA